MTLKDTRCPACGAPAEPKEKPCAHCGALLHPLKCPWCFRWGFSESKDCASCGAAAEKSSGPLFCPECRTALSERSKEGVRLGCCGKCGGIWAATESFRRLVEVKESQTAFLALPGHKPKPADPSKRPIRYRPCPSCGEFMNRANFAAGSGVVVDVCKHGTWLDPEELAQIVAFIRGGGLDRARELELEKLKLERRRLEAAKADRPEAGASPVSVSFETWIVNVVNKKL